MNKRDARALDGSMDTKIHTSAGTEGDERARLPHMDHVNVPSSACQEPPVRSIALIGRASCDKEARLSAAYESQPAANSSERSGWAVDLRTGTSDLAGASETRLARGSLTGEACALINATTSWRRGGRCFTPEC